MFKSPMFIIGAALSLESMRRGVMGGTALSLFIDLSIDNQTGCQLRVANLEKYLDIEEQLLYSLPPLLQWLWGPFLDYHNAQRCFFTIANTLCQRLQRRSCADIWERQLENADK
jgi:hypothetical protein